MTRIAILISALAVAVLGVLTGTAAQEASPAASPAVRSVAVVLQDVNGQAVGRAALAETADGAVAIDVNVAGMTPGEHGIHVHAVGVCDPAGDPPFASAGGHYNPTGAVHGALPDAGSMASPEAAATTGSPVAAAGHAGDLGNVTVDDAGTGRLQITTDRFRLAELGDADGSALVVHADRDDLRTDPTGNSGGRIACGLIVASQDGGPPAATPAA